MSLQKFRLTSLLETYVHKIVLEKQQNFHKDPYKDARVPVVNALAHVYDFMKIVGGKFLSYEKKFPIL